MILHVSVTADRPEDTARMLATLMGGIALPIGPDRQSWTAAGKDPLGNVVEVMPRGRELHRSGLSAAVKLGEPARHSGFHMLMDSVLSEAEILGLAGDAGLHAHRSSRGVFGDLIEIWIDDCLLIEVLPREWGDSYRAVIASDAVRAHVAGRVAEAAGARP